MKSLNQAIYGNMDQRFKDLKHGEFFQVFLTSGGYKTALKISDSEAWCLEDCGKMPVHKNKKVSELLPVQAEDRLCTVGGDLKIAISENSTHINILDLVWYGYRTVRKEAVKFPPGIRDNSEKITGLLQELQEIQEDEKALIGAILALVRRETK